ncbi:MULTISPECIES: cytochrome P450 [unclassified Sinorhizobium]|uniref:cytochrome P450 n=1 Tax=unclassified Sinorhizobium TaxID=2613772 RepID=UPI0024C35567|nr:MULTISPECIES: cytochrome P450 [unclassified Sinorhizobium]MDK1374746.1 cytochrome P450 [Sinorhizobium sp. 6-70]MDK1479071.1 cytochrome P450 [Sinorhizobium sp. 6-117]
MLDSIRTVPVVASSGLDADVHATFARYRQAFPFIALDTGGYVVLRHDDVVRLMSDPRLQATEIAMPAQAGVTEGALFDIFAHGMLTANGEVHVRRRSAISGALANQVSEPFRQHLRQAAIALIDASYDSGRLELASGYAAKLPILALARLFEIPEADIPPFAQDVHAMNAFFRPDPTEDAVANAETAALRVRNYLDGLLTEAEAGRSHGFLAQYLRFAEENELARVEVLVQIIQLIIGGTESVRTALIAQAAQLLSHPEQWRAVCADPTLVTNAVAEGMRFEPGIAGVIRVSLQDIEIDGWTLPAGQPVLLSFISALRDERVFDQPNVFDISRSNLNLARLAFGGGAHKCVADAMGRAELEEGLSVLVERLPKLQLENLPAFHGHLFVRKTGECWVRWER